MERNRSDGLLEVIIICLSIKVSGNIRKLAIKINDVA